MKDPTALPLFVYGSLRSGRDAHRRYCRKVLAIAPAQLWGHRSWLASGYPILSVPERAVLAEAGADPDRDAELAARLAVPSDWARRPMGDWQKISGELLLLAAPRRSLPPIDRYEDCRPAGSGPYRRVLTWVATAAGPAPAWVYCARQPRGGRADAVSLLRQKTVIAWS